MQTATAAPSSSDAVVLTPSCDQTEGPGSPGSSGWTFRIARSVGVVGFVAGLTALLYYLSIRTVVPDSDTATAVLEGQSMAAGHLTLHGWALSVDSFWSVDAVFYTVGYLLTGMKDVLLHLVPAFLASLTVVFGILLARQGRKGSAAVAAALPIFAIIGLPNSYLCYFLLKGVAHIGTTLWCLVAFLILYKFPRGWGWFVGVAFLAAGVLGDLQMLGLGMAPVLGAGIVAMVRTRSLKGGLSMTGAAIASVALAGIVRGVALLIGTFSIGKIQASATKSQTIQNLKHVIPDSVKMLGIESTHGSALAPLAVHVLTGVLAALGIIFFAIKLLLGMITGSRPRASHQRSGSSPASPIAIGKESWRLDDLLVCAYIGGMIVFVKLATANDFNYERYLTAAIIFGAILAGRFAGEIVSHLKSMWLVVGAAAIGAASLAGLGVGVNSLLAQPVLGQPQQQLGNFLESKGLHKGIGDYWSASITTVVTDGAVTVRPVIAGPKGVIVRYARQSSAAWYGGESFQFLVYDTVAPFGVDNLLATRTFGKPSATYVVGQYVVLVFPHSLSIDPIGGYDAG